MVNHNEQRGWNMLTQELDTAKANPLFCPADTPKETPARSSSILINFSTKNLDVKRPPEGSSSAPRGAVVAPECPQDAQNA